MFHHGGADPRQAGPGRDAAEPEAHSRQDGSQRSGVHAVPVHDGGADVVEIAHPERRRWDNLEQ